MTRTVLLVDDDANDVYFMRRAFKEAQIINPLQVVTDGQQAIDYLGGAGQYADRQRFPLPALVLLDVMLPIVRGFQVLEWIRQQPEFKSLVVIILTSSSLAPDVKTAYALGANSYLVKPPSPAKLTEMVTRLKQYWLDLSQTPVPCIEFAPSSG